MNKQKAIQWCVDNINTWPKHGKGIVSFPEKWCWVNSIDHDTGYRDMILINKPCNEFIKESDWIDAVMAPHCDADSVY